MAVPGAGLLALLRKRPEGEQAPGALGVVAPTATTPASGGKFEARSSAVHALEHAVAAGRVTDVVRPAAQGRRVPPGPSYTFDVDVHEPREAQPQLPVTPVTLINTDFALHHYRQNAVSGQYICYGLKQGHIRVLSRHSAVRALLKGHAKPLTDLQFSSGAASGGLLASGGQDGQLFVWQLRLDEDAAAIRDTQLLHASFVSGGVPAGDVCLSWHTPSVRVLAVGVGGRVLLVGVPQEGMEQLEFDVGDGSTPDVSVLVDWGSETVTCLSFSPDGTLLVAGGASGTVRVWQLEPRVGEGGPCLRAVSSALLPTSGAGAVGAARWLPSGASATVGWVLLTGNRNNSSLQLWHAAEGAPGAWTNTQTLHFEGKGGQADFFNNVDVAPQCQLVVLADAARKAVYTLHYSGMGAATAFDYVARFGVAVPILSFTAAWNSSGGFADGGGGGDEGGEGEPAVELNCVQTTAIQQYSLDPALCYDAETSEESEEDRADLARINSLLERPPRRDLGIRAQPSTAVPMPSDELASGHTTPHKQARSSLPPAADTDAAAAVAAEAAPAADGAAMSGPFAEPSIEDVVPALASIPPPPAQEQEQEPPEPKGRSGEVTPEECPSPPPTPTEQRQLDAEEMAAVAPLAPRLLTPSDLLQDASSPATTGRSSPASQGSSRAGGAGAAASLPPLARAAAAAAAAPAAAAAEVEEEEEPPVAAPVAAAPPSPSQPAAAGAASDAAVAAAVMEQMGGVHKKFVGHVSLMYRELLKAMRTEMTAQAAAQQQATAALLTQALEAQKQQIEAERGLVLAEERSNIERLLTAISGTLNRDLPARLAEAVRGELAGLGDSLAAAVAPAVQGALAGTLPKEVGSAVRAGLDKQLGSAVAAGLAGKPLQDAVRTAFSKQLVPAVEAATQAAFQQINAALTTGFEEHLQASQSALAEPAKLAAQLSASLASAQSLTASLSQGQQQLLRAQSVGSASGVRSPAAPADVRGELGALLRAHQYEKAFSRALGLQDVATVGWLCTQADASIVLSRDPCPLSQMVLLSLVQQLSADLTTSLGAKLAWIREAALQINPRDPVLSRHLRPVLEGVHSALQAAAGRVSGSEAASCRLAMHVVHSQITS